MLSLYRATLQRSIQRHWNPSEVPGISVALIEDAQLRWQGHFGVKSRMAALPVEANTIFEAASLSKPVFAYLVLQLCEQGIINLDVLLTSYFPLEALARRFDLSQPDLPQITARQVLSHTAGFGNWDDADVGKIRFSPGKKFAYSGEGYQYLQRAVEYVTKRPLEAHAQANIFEPLKMATSSYIWQDRFNGQFAEGHGEGRSPDVGKHWAEGFAAFSLHTTAQDFAALLIDMMRTTKIEPFQLSPKWLVRMLEPQVRINDNLAWALGWGLVRTDHDWCFWHWGDIGDYQCFAIGSRTDRCGLVIMTNSDTGLPLCQQIVSDVFTDQYAEPIKTILEHQGKFPTADSAL
jgi:CubicO group peptidase (beta-lactamase class C family)